LTGKLELAGLVRSDGQGPETHRALDGADRLIVTDRGDIIAAAQASRSACVLNNSLARSHDCRRGGGSTEAWDVQAIVRMSDAAVTFDTQIDMKGSRARASGNVMESR